MQLRYKLRMAPGTERLPNAKKAGGEIKIEHSSALPVDSRQEPWTAVINSFFCTSHDASAVLASG